MTFKVNNNYAGKIATDNTLIGYLTAPSLSGSNNAYFGDGAGYSSTSCTENTFIGHNAGKNLQTGSSNTAIGYNAMYCYGGAGGTHAGGNKNVAIGKWAMFNPISGDGNVAIGYSSYSLPNTGTENVFVGYYSDRDNNSDKNYGVAIGAHSVVDADYATAIGYRAYASQANSLILGQTTNNGNPNNATGNTNVGINTLTPETGANLTLGAMDESNEGAQITWLGAGSYSAWRTDLNQDNFRIFSESSNTTTVQIFNYGSGVSNLSIDGDAYKPGGGSWSVSSDRRSKENIKNYSKGLKELLKLRPVTFNYKKEFGWGNKTYAGLIAQEVEKVVPSMVETRGVKNIKDFKVIDPNELTYMLINAVKELKSENENLQKQINELKQKINK